LDGLQASSRNRKIFVAACGINCNLVAPRGVICQGRGAGLIRRTQDPWSGARGVRGARGASPSFYGLGENGSRMETGMTASWGGPRSHVAASCDGGPCSVMAENIRPRRRTRRSASLQGGRGQRRRPAKARGPAREGQRGQSFILRIGGEWFADRVKDDAFLTGSGAGSGTGVDRSREKG
jgi:hypothetical protein